MVQCSNANALTASCFAKRWSSCVMADELKKSKPKAATKAVPTPAAPMGSAKPVSPKAAKAPPAKAAQTAAPAPLPALAPMIQASAPVAEVPAFVIPAPAETAPVVAVAIQEDAPVAASKPTVPAVKPEPAAQAELVMPIEPVAKAPVVAAPAKLPVPVNPIPPKAAAPRSAPTAKKDFFTMNTTTTAMTDTIQTAMKDAADKAKATMEKSQATMGDMSAFAKGNVEAVVEAGKILASGMQEMSKGYMSDSKSAVETMSAEMKDLIAVKSPAEFFEKQSAMLRKQFDATVAASSKNSEAMLKLASEAFQPISNRVSLAVEKIKHAA
jgi:phasin family protein